MGRYPLLLLLLLLTSPIAVVCRSPWEVRVIGSEWVWVPAVRSADGYEGVLANLSLVVTEGSGEVYISTSPLAEIDMQGAALTAARVACEVLGLPFHKYNFYYKVYSDSIIIGGPSAGAEMTVLALAVLSGRRINRSVLMTGMILDCLSHWMVEVQIMVTIAITTFLTPFQIKQLVCPLRIFYLVMDRLSILKFQMHWIFVVILMEIRQISTIWMLLLLPAQTMTGTGTLTPSVHVLVGITTSATHAPV